MNTFSVMLGGPLPAATWFQVLQAAGATADFFMAGYLLQLTRRYRRLLGE